MASPPFYPIVHLAPSMLTLDQGNGRASYRMALSAVRLEVSKHDPWVPVQPPCQIRLDATLMDWQDDAPATLCILQKARARAKNAARHAEEQERKRTARMIVDRLGPDMAEALLEVLLLDPKTLKILK